MKRLVNIIDKGWQEFLRPLLPLIPFECLDETHYPAKDMEFNAFNYCPFKELQVVILGQDPYFTPNTANGLAFSSSMPKIPHSLSIIFNSIKENCGVVPARNPDLKRWAAQGVLLLNTALTVKPNEPDSHTKQWRPFTEKLIMELGKKDLTWLLWGKHAKSFAPLIKNGTIHEDIHPAARQGKFNGNFHLVKTVTWI
ncbi:MAG TPA: uracil-DNA glycosylase [Burkholderiales bacterium]|nr:uracil-DNA glycosylase [Burkholderiales bacterium]